MKPIDLTNRQIGRLKVIADVGVIRNGDSHVRLWLCACSCGSTVERRSSQLLKGAVRSCGCLRSEKARARVLLPPGESGFRDLLRRYRTSATKKHQSFSLSTKLFKRLVTSPCYYCGAKPTQVSRIEKGETSFLYNGLDRYRNDRGYSVRNTVPCCQDCNFMKGARNGDDFISKVRRISVYVPETIVCPPTNTGA